MDKKVMFAGEECTIKWYRYTHGGSIAMQLWCSEGPMCRATVNIPNLRLAPDEVVIKDYSENHGVQEALIKAGIIEDTGETACCGYAICSICKLLVIPDKVEVIA